MDEVSSAIIDRCVAPFYLRMMRLNAIKSGLELAPAMVEAAQDLVPADVVVLLKSHWRPRVMGAWLALTMQDEHVQDELFASLVSSRGSLTAPPLATAAVSLTGAKALPALRAYAVADLTEGWGAAGFVAAAIQHVGGETDCAPSPADTACLAEMLRVAARLREGGPGSAGVA